MPNDLVTLKALCAEMDDALIGGRIDKIGMPSEEEIVLMIRAKGVNRHLYFCCRSDMPRVHFSTQKYVNTPVPPNFCMLLRKHLSGGVIERVTTLNEDRLVEFTIMTRNELNDATRFRVIIEIMGGASNVVLCNDEYKILDAVKRVMNEHSRTVFPQASYTYPAKSKALLTDVEAVSEVVVSEDVKKVYGQINGLSKESALELIAVSKESGSKVASTRINDLYRYEGYSPCTQYDESGKCIGFFAYPYLSRKEKGSYKNEVDLSSAIEAFYRDSALESKKHRDTLKLNQKLKALITKTERRIKDNLRTIEDSKNKDKFRELGEILKCNLYRVERGMSIIKCDDFYNTCEVEIPLDPTISAQKNVEKYFKRYNKAKGAENYAKAEITKLYELEEYLKSIKASIQTSSTDAEYKEINAELDALKKGGKKEVSDGKKKNPKLPKKTPPLTFEIGGFKVYVGRNNTQNDEVTFNVAEGGDLWLHTKTYHGSHGVILSHGKAVPDSVIERVAEVVSYYSEARDNPKAEVDYTLRKHVKKLGKPGLVNYVNYKTIVVKPTDWVKN